MAHFYGTKCSEAAVRDRYKEWNQDGERGGTSQLIGLSNSISHQQASK